MNRILIASLIVLAVDLLPAHSTNAKELCIASWNVENLFDTEDDPKVKYDEDFTPDSPKKWTKERLEIKLNNLSDAIKKMNGGKGPDALGLCEVENRKVVEMLRDKLASLGRKYEIIHQDSPSDRGIDCAMLYDSDVFNLADSKFHFVDAERTRDIIEAKLHRDSGDLFMFVNHWPSRNNKEWQRLKAADVLRKRLDEIFAADPKADVILVGDFNDEPDNIALKDNLKSAKSKDNLPAGSLFDTTAYLKDDKRGTHFYDNEWEVLDHIIISPGLLDNAHYHWKDGSTERIDRKELIYQPPYKDALPRPSTSYSKNSFHKNGYSDHLAVTCIIEDEPAQAEPAKKP